MGLKPKYVTFEQSKLLTKKGFDEECDRFYVKPNSKLFGIDEHGRYYPIKNKTKELWVVGNVAVQNIKNIILAPEQWQVVEWVLQVHKIFISVMPYDTITSKKEWTTTIFDMEWGEDKEIHFNKKIGGCETKEDAYSAAFDYILKTIL